MIAAQHPQHLPAPHHHRLSLHPSLYLTFQLHVYAIARLNGRVAQISSWVIGFYSFPLQILI